MFNVNDTVVYGTAGVCKISEITEMAVPGGAGKSAKYYVLSPIDAISSKVYIPIDNEGLTARMKRVMSRDEANHMLDDGESCVDWVEERRAREEKYSQIIAGGDKREILSVLRLLYGAKLEAESHGKKQYIADKRLMTLAEKIIGEEFSYVMELPKGSIAKYIYERMAVAN